MENQNNSPQNIENNQPTLHTTEHFTQTQFPSSSTFSNITPPQKSQKPIIIALVALLLLSVSAFAYIIYNQNTKIAKLEKSKSENSKQENNDPKKNQEDSNNTEEANKKSPKPSQTEQQSNSQKPTSQVITPSSKSAEPVYVKAAEFGIKIKVPAELKNVRFHISNTSEHKSLLFVAAHTAFTDTENACFANTNNIQDHSLYALAIYTHQEIRDIKSGKQIAPEVLHSEPSFKNDRYAFYPVAGQGLMCNVPNPSQKQKDAESAVRYALESMLKNNISNL